MAVSVHIEAAVSMHEIPFRASHEKEIEDWARKHFGAVKFQRLEVKGYDDFSFFAVFRTTWDRERRERSSMSTPAVLAAGR